MFYEFIILMKNGITHQFTTKTNMDYIESASQVLNEIESRKRTIQFGETRMRRKHIAAVYFNVDAEPNVCDDE